jgi:hypothetical protein
MAEHIKYLLTVDATTGRPIKAERLGDAGELSEVALNELFLRPPAPPPAASTVSGTPQSVVINIFMGGQPQPVSTTSVAASSKLEEAVADAPFVVTRLPSKS